MFDPELLKTFIAVAESGGFTRAAARLHSTQSTVSAQIQRLESDAGNPLFVRNTRSVRLTSAGELLLSYARTILRLNEDAHLHLSGRQQVGTMRVGAAEDLVPWLPRILRAFSRQYPEVRIEVEIGIGMDLFSMVETQALDLALGGICVGDFGGRRLWQEQLVWAFASDIDVPDPLPLVFFPQPCPYREAALRALASTRRQWHIACTSSSLAGVRVIATAGIAVTPLPLHAVTSGLRILGKEDKLPGLPKVDYVLASSSAAKRPIVTAFSEHCERTLSTESGSPKLPRIPESRESKRRF